MTTVPYLATVQVPCSWCHTLGCRDSLQDCVCPDGTCNDGTVPAWLVGPWNGEHGCHYPDCSCPDVPPADLVALIGADCDTCGGMYEEAWQERDWASVETVQDCPDCIDGRPAVEVVRPLGVWAVGKRITETLGRGTIRPDHILPLTDNEDAPSPIVLYDDEAGTERPEITLWLKDNDRPAWLDIDVSPGQYVAIVTPEQR